MDVRRAALKAVVKILEKGIQADEVLNFYSGRVLFASELNGLVSGVVKHKLTLDFFIDNFASKRINDLWVRNILRLAIYELEYRQNPDYAVLNSYVEITKLYNKSASGFVNGVLRNFLREKSCIVFPDIKKDPIEAISIKYSHPEWMVKRWIKHYGVNDTVEICQYNNLAPKLVIRVNTIKISKEQLQELFVKHNIPFTGDRMVSDCLILHTSENVKNIPGFAEGYWIVQSEASSLVSIVLDPQEGEHILDLCAAPGGKTTHIAALMHDKGKVAALDLNPKRLEKVKDNCKRLGIKSVTTLAADSTKYTSEEKYDRVLIDAPCSNTGVLIKRIDARWNKSLEDIQNLSRLQLEILNNAANLVKSGGIIVYSTCSIESEENEEVIEKFLAQNKNFIPDKIAPYLPFNVDKDKGYFQILQSRQNIDGFFIARLKKI